MAMKEMRSKQSPWQVFFAVFFFFPLDSLEACMYVCMLPMPVEYGSWGIL